TCRRHRPQSPSVYTDSEPKRVFWGADEELSNGGSPRVIVYGYDGLPMIPVAPPSPDYIPGPEEPQTPPAPQDEDEHKLMQPHDPNFDPEEYEEDETEDGPVGYPMDGGDNGDDDDIDSSGYDSDNEDEDKEDEEEEEEEHLALADSTVVISSDELVAPSEETEPTIPPPSADTATIGAKITIRPQTSISLLPEAEVETLLAMPTQPPSPLISLSPPSAEERLARCTAPTVLPSPPLPPSSYPPSHVDRRDDILESERPPRKREVGYGIRDTWIDPAEAVHEIASTTLENVNTRVTELAELYEHDTQELYALLEDAQDRDDMDCEGGGICCLRARTQLVALNQTTHHELQTLREQTQQQLHETHSQMQQTEMAGLQETNRLRQTQIVETLRVMRDMRREMDDMQAELLALRGQSRRAGQPGGDIRVPNHQDARRDADSHI
nr:hypothetical protein [Tanacetum cinerariifolium]